MIRGSYTKQEIDEQKKRHEKMEIYSQFEFLREHNGIRLGNLHGLLGTAGSGKSTLLKSIIAFTSDTKPTLTWLSEETVQEYQVGLNRITTSESVLKNMKFVEEKNLDEFYFRNQDTFYEIFEDMVVESGARVVFIDNLSTSYFYNDVAGISGQARTANFLSRITKKLGIAVFFVIHTKKDIQDNHATLVTKEDVRGSQQIAIVSEYFYILQKFTVNDRIYNIVKVDKHRHHEINKRFFLMGFDEGAYKFDKAIEFETLNKIFVKRDRLGRK